MTAGETTAALLDLNAALKLDPRLGAAYELRGDLLAAAKLYQQALKDYRAALTLSENTATAERIGSKGMRVATLMQKELPEHGLSDRRANP